MMTIQEIHDFFYYMDTTWFLAAMYFFVAAHWLLCGVPYRIHPQTNMLQICFGVIVAISLHWVGDIYTAYLVAGLTILFSYSTIRFNFRHREL